MDHLKLTMDKLSVETVSELVTDDSCGAVSMFIGTTRDSFEDKMVLRLEYEAYEPMALKAMKSICTDVRGKWPAVHGIAIYHRLGQVPTREASVIIAVSSPHRQDSLAAVAHCIDALKGSVAIWKKEIYDNHEPVWKENSECGATKDSIKQEMQKPDQDASVDDMVQINVSCDEIQKRIQSFIERKREQVNISNIHDFIPSLPAEGGCEDGGGGGCARVRTVFIKRTDSKGHLKIRKVCNDWGPQTAKPEVKQEVTDNCGLPPAIAERVHAIDKFLGIAPVARDVYRRLKEIEDKIAYLQALSPEYAQFWRNGSSKCDNDEGNMNYTFTADDIMKKIDLFENKGIL